MGKHELKYKTFLDILCIQTVKKPLYRAASEICILAKRLPWGFSYWTRNSCASLYFCDMLFFFQQKSSLRPVFSETDLFAFYLVVHHVLVALSSSEKSVPVKFKLEHQKYQPYLKCRILTSWRLKVQTPKCSMWLGMPLYVKWVWDFIDGFCWFDIASLWEYTKVFGKSPQVSQWLCPSAIVVFSHN